VRIVKASLGPARIVAGLETPSAIEHDDRLTVAVAVESEGTGWTRLRRHGRGSRNDEYC
jgi:hypothetical protein